MKTIRCENCGSDVLLNGNFVCICPKCNAEYNTLGQRLAPRSQWGWETNESVADFISCWGEEY